MGNDVARNKVNEQNLQPKPKCEWPASVRVTFETTPRFLDGTMGKPLAITFTADFPEQTFKIVNAKVDSNDIPINGKIASAQAPIIITETTPLLSGNMSPTPEVEGLEGVNIAFSKEKNMIYFTGGELIKPDNSEFAGSKSYPLTGVILFKWNPCQQK